MTQSTPAASTAPPQAAGHRTTAPYGTGPAGSAAGAAPVKRIRIHHLRAMKERGERFAMLTAYEQYAAEIFDEAGIPLLLVGDSAANNVFGYETTLSVTVDELLPLVGAVSRSARRALVVADLPFGAYQSSPIQALETAVRFMKEGGAHAVKLEGGAHVVPHVEAIVQAGIPVMAHIGFTPQSEHALGGYRVQGRGEAGDDLVKHALALEEAGAFAVVLEMVPSDVAARITEELRDPDHRHRRRPALRRTGARLAGHGRAAQGADAAVRQAGTPTCAPSSAVRPRRSPTTSSPGPIPTEEQSYR